MKMSTMVKDYVRERIREKYPYVEMPKRFDTNIVLEEIKKATMDVAKAIVEKYSDRIGFRCYRGNGVYELIDMQDNEFYLGYKGSIVDLKRYEAEQTNKAIDNKRYQVFRDIVVQMELGGTKKDLDELLANLPD